MRSRRSRRAGIYSNGGPVVRGFEAAATAQLFGGAGDCLAVGNATLGLMLAIRHAAGPRAGKGNFALIPAFTFAATAHAAEWAGLTPLLCDVDPEDWAASAEAEARAFEKYGDRIAAVVPYATFGAGIDLARYRGYAERGVGVVIDAAASLGALDADGRQFGAGEPFAVVYSMHATKVFATAEGGLVHSGDAGLIEALRRMSNFGFAGGRSAEGPGFNAKLPEVLGLVARAKLDEIEAVAAHRMKLDAVYRAALGGFAAEKGFEFQELRGSRPALQFQSLLLPRAFAGHRRAIIETLGRTGDRRGALFQPASGRAALVPRAWRERAAAGVRRCRRAGAVAAGDRRDDRGGCRAGLLCADRRVRGIGAQEPAGCRTARGACPCGADRRWRACGHGLADRGEQERRAGAAGQCGTCGSRARCRARARGDRHLCDHFGQHRRDVPHCREGQRA